MRGPAFYTSSFFEIQSDKTLLLERLKRILLTIPGERVNNTEFGSHLKMYLFETDINLLANLPTILREDLNKWEPTVNVQDVIVDIQDHIAYINILLTMKETGETFDYDLSLEF